MSNHIHSPGHLLVGKVKAVRDPVFMSLSGAHGLLKFAVQLLTEKAGSKPHRRYKCILALSVLHVGSGWAVYWLRVGCTLALSKCCIGSEWAVCWLFRDCNPASSFDHH